jgi:hypothetical protein
MSFKTAFLWPLGVAFSLLACKSTPEKCKYKPVAIFSNGLPHVQQYNYEVQGHQSMESILLDTGILLEVGQDVCASTRQEFRFTVPGDRSAYPDSLWLKEAARQMVFLSSFSPQQAPLRTWGDMIEEVRLQMRLGEALEVQPGITVQVDRITGKDQSTLQVILAQE